MADGTTFINVPQTGAAPEDYLVSGASSIDLLAARADFDGSGAAGDFLPALQIVDEAGQVVATTFGSTVTAGGSASVTFAPFLGRDTGQTAGGGIDFNKVNDHAADGAEASYLEIETIGPDSIPGHILAHASWSFVVNDSDPTNSPGFELVGTDGPIVIVQTANGTDPHTGNFGLLFRNDGGLDTGLVNTTTGKLIVRNTNGDVYIEALANKNVIMAHLPNADPGVSGALYVDGGGLVKQSP